MAKNTTPHPPCRYPGCLRPAAHLTGRFPGYCKGHYSQLWKGQSLQPLKKPDRPKLLSLTELMAYVETNLINKTEAGCWEFQGYRNHRGYGKIQFQGGHKRVHRLMLMAQGIEIPAGYEVCHTCDNTSCCRVDHLYVGTHADNMKDRSVRGRHTSRKLTFAQAQEIRGRYAAGGTTHHKLAGEYGVHHTTVANILYGKIYRC